MGYLTIGEFAERTRLSPKALRIYDDLGLVAPAWTDPLTGYRHYGEDQVARARLVGSLRQLDMPLVVIAQVVDLPGPAAAEELERWWSQAEDQVAARRLAVRHLQSRLRGEASMPYNVQLRSFGDRRVAYINRHVTGAEVDAFFDEAFGRLRAAGTGLTGMDGAPFLIFYGEVSDDSDGPVELCRPLAGVPVAGDVPVRSEPAHEEAYIRLGRQEAQWPAMMSAIEALEKWVTDHNRQPAGALRQLFFSDVRSADADEPVCDLSVPLR